MLNIETAALPNTTVIEGQIATTDGTPAAADASLFSLTLESETQKVQAAEDSNTIAGIGDAALVGLVVPEAAEAPSVGTPRTKSFGGEDNDAYLLLIPFLAGMFNEPRWQNLPGGKSSAGPASLPETTSPPEGVAAATPVAVETAPASSPNTETEKPAPAGQTPNAWPIPRAPQHGGVIPVPGLLIDDDSLVPIEPYTPQPWEAAAIESGGESKEFQATPSAEVDDFVPTQRSAEPTRGRETWAAANREPVPIEDPQIATPVTIDNAALASDLVSVSVSSAEEVSGKADVPTSPRGDSQEQNSVTQQSNGEPLVIAPGVIADSPSQDNLSRDTRRANPSDVEIQVTVTPPRKEMNSPGRAALEPRPEAKHGDLVSDLRTSGVVHEAKSHSPVVRSQESIVASPSEQWSQVEKANVLSQLVEKARSFRWEQNSEIVVSLKPESLGRISMRASLIDKTMVATITAESDRVRELIQGELPVIQRSLQESGIPSKVVVSQQNEWNLNHSNPGNGQHRFRYSEPNPYLADEVTTAGTDATVVIADSRYSSNSVHLIA